MGLQARIHTCYNEIPCLCHIASWDNHEALVQVALEQSVPVMIGMLGSMCPSYPVRVFDMVWHSQCPMPWALNDEVYLTGIDRAPRPYGYWTLYGSPINWKTTTNKGME